MTIRDRLSMLVVLALVGVMAGCGVSRLGAQKLANAPLCCKDVSAIEYQKLEVDQAASFKIDESSPVFQFPSTRSYFHAFSLPSAETPYTLTLKSYLTNAEVTILASKVFCPVVMILDANFKIRADYLRPLSFDDYRQSDRAIPLSIPLTPVDRYVIVHTEQVLIGKETSLDLGPASPFIPAAVGGATILVPNPDVLLEKKGEEHRTHHLVPCDNVGKMSIVVRQN